MPQNKAERLALLLEVLGSPVVRRRGFFDPAYYGVGWDSLGALPSQPQIDTLVVRSTDDMLAELAHAAQFRGSKARRDSLYDLLVEESDSKKYRTKGTIEYQAHRQIEPLLRRFYRRGQPTSVDSLMALLNEIIYENK